MTCPPPQRGSCPPLEGRRPRHPHPEGSQNGIREAAIAGKRPYIGALSSSIVVVTRRQRSKPLNERYRDISTTIRIKCSQLNILLLRIAGSSTTTTVRDSSKTRKTDSAYTHQHLTTGVRPRWRVLRPYPMGSGRRGRHWAGDNIVDSPHRLHAWLVPLIV